MCIRDRKKDSCFFYRLYSTQEIMANYVAPLATDWAFGEQTFITAGMPRMTGDDVAWQPDSVPIGTAGEIFDIWIEISTGKFIHWHEGYEAHTHTSYLDWLEEKAHQLETDDVEYYDGKFSATAQPSW